MDKLTNRICATGLRRTPIGMIQQTSEVWMHYSMIWPIWKDDIIDLLVVHNFFEKIKYLAMLQRLADTDIGWHWRVFCIIHTRWHSIAFSQSCVRWVGYYFSGTLDWSQWTHCMDPTVTRFESPGLCIQGYLKFWMYSMEIYNITNFHIRIEKECHAVALDYVPQELNNLQYIMFIWNVIYKIQKSQE